MAAAFCRKYLLKAPKRILRVFAEIIEHIGELMVDPFAHYLLQKILEECSNDQRMHIICELTKVPLDLLKVSCNMHGYEL
jgi:hypothetical protein